jgi:cell division protein ZipA
LDTSTLRWVIIIIGILVLASVFLFGNPNKKRSPRASRKKENSKVERLEPTLEQAEWAVEAEVDFEINDEAGQGELPIESPEPEPMVEPASPPKPAGPPPDKIKSLFLMSRDKHIINGAELLQTAINTGMEFGEMNIFHRIYEGSEKPVFSMANAAKPGHFDRDAWNTFETKGVVLFMTLPGPSDALDAWDSLFATAQRMAEILQADLLDEEHCPFTRQKEAQIREEMREYDRNQP